MTAVTPTGLPLVSVPSPLGTICIRRVWIYLGEAGCGFLDCDLESCVAFCFTVVAAEAGAHPRAGELGEPVAIARFPRRCF
eukprot:846892-Pleurochrysis_carterae.AAC.1